MRWQAFASAGLVVLAAIAGGVVAGGLGSSANTSITVRTADSSTTTTAPEVADEATTTTVGGETAEARPAAEVSVVIVNGSGVRGAAAKRTDTLKNAGYRVLTPQDAKTSSATGAVYFREGYEASARQVAADLGFDAGAVAALPLGFANAPDDANVVVLLGTDTSD